ncbi:MAG: hypothetical protein ACLQPH_01265 [Acidimicrobiales bacterium]
MRRLFTTAAVVAALCIPASAATIGLAGTAGAAAKPKPKPTAGSSVVCTALKFTSKTKKGVTTDTIAFSKCFNNSGAIGAPNSSVGSTNAAALLTGGPLTWKTSGLVTTLGTPTLTTATPGVCAAGDTQYTEAGAVVAPTTQSLTPVGDLTAGSVCVQLSPLKITLAPGSPGFAL